MTLSHGLILFRLNQDLEHRIFFSENRVTVLCGVACPEFNSFYGIRPWLVNSAHMYLWSQKNKKILLVVAQYGGTWVGGLQHKNNISNIFICKILLGKGVLKKFDTLSWSHLFRLNQDLEHRIFFSENRVTVLCMP